MSNSLHKVGMTISDYLTTSGGYIDVAAVGGRFMGWILFFAKWEKVKVSLIGSKRKTKQNPDIIPQGLMMDSRQLMKL